ncbi:hypothetical protein SAMN06265222_105249 [Neorhodopirellula lusitana]|uniref:Uncharacterized protein n=1 Tax=Neorhodopirellula lusitana TaxID=445327 RepID=A0ABY1Q269_9BACT|nr:hypothetical protein SAMN06265222_105249 [Neorhodopirellula lusitana]
MPHMKLEPMKTGARTIKERLPSIDFCIGPFQQLYSFENTAICQCKLGCKLAGDPPILRASHPLRHPT